MPIQAKSDRLTLYRATLKYAIIILLMWVLLPLCKLYQLPGKTEKLKQKERWAADYKITVTKPAKRKMYSTQQVRMIRNLEGRLHMSQGRFADRLGISFGKASH